MQRRRFGIAVALAALIAGGCARTPEQREAKFLASGSKMMEKREYARAVLEFRNAVAARPGDAEAHYQLALAYLKAGQAEQATVHLRKATELNPRHSGAQVRLAELLVSTRVPALAREAEKHLQGVLDEHPTDNDAVFAMGAAEWRLGKPEEAEQYLRDVLHRAPDHLRSSLTLAAIKLSAKDWKGAEEVLQSAIGANPKSASALVALGILYAGTNRFPEAEARLSAAAGLDPMNARALLNLAAVKRLLHKNDEAEGLYKRVAGLPREEYRDAYGQYLFETGQIDRAVAEFQRVFAANPKSRVARTRLVQALIAAHKPADAERILNTALDRNRKDVDALLARSRLYLRQGNTAGAERDAAAVLAVEPKSSQAHFLLAVVQKERGDSLRERDELGQALRSSADMLAARIALASNLIQARFGRAALDTMNQTPAAQKHLLAAVAWRNWALLAAGDIPGFRQGVSAALAANGASPEIQMENATLKLQDKEFEACRRILDPLLAQNPEELRALRLMVQSYTAQHQNGAATERLRAHVDQHPGSAVLQHLLGGWYEENGRAAEARDAFQAAKRAQPGFTAADLSLAELDLKQGDARSARERLVPIVAANPGNADAQLLLALAEEAAGNYDNAIALYEKLLSAGVPNALVANNLAYLLAEHSGRATDALKYAQRAGQMLPGNAAVEETLGWVYFRAGHYREAVRYLERSAGKYPTARREYHLAMAYAKSGDQRRAVDAVKEGLKLDPKLPEASMAMQLVGAPGSGSSR